MLHNLPKTTIFITISSRNSIVLLAVTCFCDKMGRGDGHPVYQWQQPLQELLYVPTSFTDISIDVFNIKRKLSFFLFISKNKLNDSQYIARIGISRSECSIKNLLLKISQKLCWRPCCFPVNYIKLLKIPVLQDICERLSVCCK